MAEYDLNQIVAKIRSVGTVSPPNMPVPISLRCEASAPVSWDKTSTARRLKIAVPPDLEELWGQASSLRLFEDVSYGQWGLVLWSPTDIVAENQRRIAARKKDFRAGDLLLGEFLGDSDLLMIRAAPRKSDFGKVMIALPIDPRREWPEVAKSFASFLDRFVESKGDKYWEQ